MSNCEMQLPRTCPRGFEVTLYGRFWVTPEGETAGVVSMRMLLRSYRNR